MNYCILVQSIRTRKCVHSMTFARKINALRNHMADAIGLLLGIRCKKSVKKSVVTNGPSNQGILALSVQFPRRTWQPSLHQHCAAQPGERKHQTVSGAGSLVTVAVTSRRERPSPFPPIGLGFRACPSRALSPVRRRPGGSSSRPSWRRQKWRQKF